MGVRGVSLIGTPRACVIPDTNGVVEDVVDAAANVVEVVTVAAAAVAVAIVHAVATCTFPGASICGTTAKGETTLVICSVSSCTAFSSCESGCSVGGS